MSDGGEKCGYFPTFDMQCLRALAKGRSKNSLIKQSSPSGRSWNATVTWTQCKARRPNKIHQAPKTQTFFPTLITLSMFSGKVYLTMWAVDADIIVHATQLHESMLRHVWILDVGLPMLVLSTFQSSTKEICSRQLRMFDFPREVLCAGNLSMFYDWVDY